ncbi:Ribosome-binding factor A [Candidatus Magnetomoraceae bacterium gMMP-15]
MKSFPRADRVGIRIKQELSELLLKNIKDPRLEMVTITTVKVSRDLRSARIYYSLLGDEEKKQNTAKGFKSALGFLKREMAARLGLRYMPDLKFFYDESFDYGSHIDKILDNLHLEDTE